MIHPTLSLNSLKDLTQSAFEDYVRSGIDSILGLYVNI